ncbi:FtsX-like permease family protein [Sulfurovum sp. zt1-1]|uniref:FtsX-like permease family protein n=1 Tax=Sulfurovum zhangzhouensis TaxID=3019067 RepID=A0ABT7QX91_9BACT|nr:FtsX-like permease family protein [Sulfurovum zhangzhouensis]MDM5271448.1 FtsX-like permease family protein [Sulfurovum zhangzhouensis]
MLNKYPFLHFLTLLLFKQKIKHMGIMSISVIMVTLVSSVLFISTSLQHTLQDTLAKQADFTVNKIEAGRSVKTPLAWVDKIIEIEGVSDVTPRVHGRYFYAPGEESFLIVGIDFFEEQSAKALQVLLKDVDLKQFFSTDSMIVGKGVKTFFQTHYYTDSFSFKTPHGVFKKVKIYEVLPNSLNLFTNDMIIMPIELAREIFGLGEDEVTDITFNVPNDAEWDNIISKLHLLDYDMRVVEKREIQKAYENLYNYKGGIFLILYIISLLTFMLILYQRYSMVYSNERKEIGILRAVGWSIKDILRLKFYETLILVITSFIIGVVVAYGYVFILGAPILIEIFLGGANLSNEVRLIPTIEFGVLGSIFLLYAVPFFTAVLIPAWRIAVIPPKEAMQ